jgi:hypothetical protein
MRKHLHFLIAIAAVAGFAYPAVAQTNLILNGSFEANGGVGTSIFPNWTVTDLAGSNGSWFVQTGATSPVSGFAVAFPTNGTFAAMTDQTGAGTHALIQSFVVPAGGVSSAILTFDWFVGNRDGIFVVNPAGLDHTAVPNQHDRVDILTGAAAPFSTAPSDVLLNALISNPSDPLVSGYNRLSIDVTALLNANAGSTLQLRFAEVDNQSFFQFGADNVSLLVSVPEPATWGLMGLTGLLGSGAYFWRRRQARAKAEEVIG